MTGMTLPDTVMATRATKIHELKCWPQFFNAIVEGRKRHDLRRSYDRDFEVGDKLRLREFSPVDREYTGRVHMVEVTYVTSADLPCALSGDALHPDYCILSIASISGT